MYVQNKQSDQLGRIFAYWAIVSLVGHFLKKLQKETKNLGLLFSTEKSYVCINFDKNGLGHIFGDFFTNSSCHPENKHTGDAHTYRGIVAQVIQSITTFFFRRQFSVLLAFVLSWSVVMIFIFFSPKNMAFLTKNIACLCTYGKMILTFVIKKRQFFRRKWAKIAKISDHNIDPRLFVYKLVMQVM
jgi:hypothetical protein